MNALVNYASDSDSENEEPPITQQRQQGQQEDDFLLSALKDLQSFADSVDDGPADRPDIDEDGFQSFLKEIDAIPCPSENRDQPVLPPPPPPSEPFETGTSPPPPPPPPPETSLTAHLGNIQETTLHHVKSIHSRLYHISLLPSTSIDQKDLERRLLEFAIRIVDWEKGGLYEAYFLGRELAEAVVAYQQQGGTVSTDSVELPSFGGVVGSMIKHLHHLEQMAAPLGWSAIWDADDEAYGFQHSRTGTYSPIYPSQELIQYLDPPSRTPGSGPPALSIQSRSYFGSRTTPSPKDTSGLTMTFVQGAWNPTPPSLQSPTSTIVSPTNTSHPTTVPKTTASKLKKRKAEDDATERATLEESVFQDQHIHPSRRAVLTNKPGAATSVSTAATLGSSSSSSKAMPKKLASLLQKWSEKDKEESDEDEDEQKHEYQTGGRQELNTSSVPMTGANSQSLGGDWRDRRLRPK